MPDIHGDPYKIIQTHLTPCAVQIKRGGGYELPAQRQNEPLVSVKKPVKERMVAWSLGCPCLPHQYNLISLCQTCPSTAFRQQFTFSLCFHLPAPLPQASGLLLKPSCTETRHIFQENHTAWRQPFYFPSNFNSAFRPSCSCSSLSSSSSS